MMDAALRALRALRDCGVVRARRSAPGYLGLWADGLADAKPVEGRALCDFSLTSAGAETARQELVGGGRV